MNERTNEGCVLKHDAVGEKGTSYMSHCTMEGLVYGGTGWWVASLDDGVEARSSTGGSDGSLTPRCGRA